MKPGSSVFSSSRIIIFVGLIMLARVFWMSTLWYEWAALVGALLLLAFAVAVLKGGGSE